MREEEKKENKKNASPVRLPIHLKVYGYTFHVISAISLKENNFSNFLYTSLSLPWF